MLYLDEGKRLKKLSEIDSAQDLFSPTLVITSALFSGVTKPVHCSITRGLTVPSPGLAKSTKLLSDRWRKTLDLCRRLRSCCRNAELKLSTGISV